MRSSVTAAPSSSRISQRQAEAAPGNAASRYGLGALLAFGALNAFAGGSYGLAGAKGVPQEWLRGSPFRDYVVPSLILVVAVGGSFLVAAVAVFARWRYDRLLAIAAAAILFSWLAVEVAIIGYVSWMQPATALGGVLVLALAWRLPSRRLTCPRRRTTT